MATWVNTFPGPDGAQVTAGGINADEAGGGAGSNATYVTGGLNPGADFAVRITATRRFRNDDINPDLDYAFVVWNAPSGNPPSVTTIGKFTAGGVNNIRGGIALTSSGKVRLLGGSAPDSSNVDSEKSYADTRTWAAWIERDRLGALNEFSPGTPRQRVWIFDNNGHPEEILTSSLTNSDAHDAFYWGIATDSITWTCDFGEPQGGPVRVPTAWHAAFDTYWTAPPTQDSSAFTILTGGVEKIRATTTGGTIAPRMSSEVDVDDYGLATVVVRSLPDAGTNYSHAVEGFDGTTWRNLTSIDSITARSPGSTQSDVIVDWTCHKKDDTGVLFDKLAVRAPNVGMWVNKGDWHYDNPGTNPKDALWAWQWIKAWRDQIKLVPGIEAAARAGCYTSPDDHDIGVANNEFNTPNIDRCFAALPMFAPISHLAPLGMPSTGTFYCAIQRGEVLHVFTQFTSNYRSDPADPDPGWVEGDPAPSKSPFGAAQDAWLEALLTSSGPGGYEGEGGYVAYCIYFNKGWYWDQSGSSDPGDPDYYGDLGGKEDHHHLYPDHRAWLSSLMSQRRVFQFHGDNHMSYGNDEAPISGCPLIHCAGALRESGNTTWDVGADDDKIFPEWVRDPDDPGDPGTDVSLELATVIEISRAGANFTIRASVYDALLESDRFYVEKTWTNVPFVGDHGWFINGESLGDLGVRVLNDSDALRIAPKRGANKVLAGVNGTIFQADKRTDENQLTLRLGLTPEVATSANLKSITDYLSRLLSDGEETDLIGLRLVDEVGSRRCDAEVTAAVSHSRFGDSYAFATVQFDVPGAFFEDDVIISQTLPFVPNDDGQQTLWFTAFAGATAPTQKAVVTLSGQFDTPLISDPVGRAACRYLGTVNAGNDLVIDCVNFTVTENDVDKLDVWEQRGVGPFLTLMPRRSDGAYGLRINVASDLGGNPEVTLATRRYFRLP